MQRVSLPLSPYTNCIATLVHSDGSTSPCYCFTYNKDFFFDESGAADADDKNECLQELYDKYGINTNQVQYVAPKAGKNSKFVRESAAIVQKMLRGYALKDFGTKTIHTDNGNAFKDRGEDIIELKGFTRFTSPSCIH